jgi:hypothetical protein
MPSWVNIRQSRLLFPIATICICFGSAFAQRQKPLASVRFELVREKIFVKARVNGSKDINLQFDTGAGSASIDDSTAEKLKLVASGETKNEGAAGSASVPISTNNTIEVNGLKFPDITLMHFSLGDYFGTKRDVVIGYDMLKSYVIKIDYDTRTMEFYDARSFKYSGKGKVNRFILWSNSALMDIDLTLFSGERLRGKFLVDNGADLPLIVNSPFVNKNGLMQKVGKVAKGSISGSDGSEVPTFRGKVQWAAIGGHTFIDFPVRLTQAQFGTLSLNDLDGILGNPILKMFNITFDYRRKKMYWEPNQLFSQKVS